MWKRKKNLFLLLIFVSVLIWTVYKLMIPAIQPPFFGIHLEGMPIDEARLDDELNDWSFTPHFIGFFEQWPEKPESFAAKNTEISLKSIRARGSVPVITWEPMFIEADREVVIAAEEILAGKWKDYLKSYANVLKNYKHPVIIRFAHEMNLVRYHWGTSKADYHNSPLNYKEMFRHVQSMVINEGASNTIWMFCPNHQPLTALNPPQQAKWNKMKKWFPGKSYVNLMGIDGYNWGLQEPAEEYEMLSGSWQSPWDIFASPLTELRTLAPQKPVFIGETASVPAGKKREQWISNLFHMAEVKKVNALMWFQIDKEYNWRLTKDETFIISSMVSQKKLKDTESWLNDLLIAQQNQSKEASSVNE